MTLQAWYKALRALRTKGIVTKVAKQYSLNVAWIVDVSKWARVMQAHYTDTEQALRLPEKKGEKVRFAFRDLLSMNIFWAHLLVHIGSQYEKPQTLWAYNPHFWFYVAHSDIEKQFDRSMEEVDVHTYLIIGSNSFLDSWSRDMFDPKNITSWLSPKPLFAEAHKYYNVLGDYFIEVTLNKTTALRMEKLFQNTTSLSDTKRFALLEFFQNTAPCKIEISKGSTKGKRIKNKIKKHFF